jgi:hypothetical protein
MIIQIAKDIIRSGNRAYVFENNNNNYGTDQSCKHPAGRFGPNENKCKNVCAKEEYFEYLVSVCRRYSARSTEDYRIERQALKLAYNHIK